MQAKTLLPIILLLLLLAGCSQSSLNAILDQVLVNPPAQNEPAAAEEAATSPLPTPTTPPLPPSPEPSPPPASPEPDPTPDTAIIGVYISPHVGDADASSISNALLEAEGEQGPVFVLVADAAASDVIIDVQPLAMATGQMLSERTFAAVVPFTTVRDGVSLGELEERWAGNGSGPLFVTPQAADDLAVLFPPLQAEIVDQDELAARVKASPGAMALLPFDQLDPTWKVLAIDGINPLHRQADLSLYPLAVGLLLDGNPVMEVSNALAGQLPSTNRDLNRMSTLVMTGVTAMSRLTAQRMERKGYDYPAREIGETLRQADITHVSNEVPFIPGCRVNASSRNLRFCSKPEYWAALEAIGTDIVGLSGNHVNDFGRKGARTSIAFYRDNEIPIYGSGLNREEACAPLLVEQGEHTFAFIAALAWGPKSAWAKDDQPGACYYYQNRSQILDTIRRLESEVDIVAVELQFYEIYRAKPSAKQVREFRELRQAGADIVTGVQSHVPQAVEPGTDTVIVYGLGNLFFDQMQSWQTRAGIIARHTIYDGRLLSTELLTTMLHNFAQPRWADEANRARILRRIFATTPS